MITLSNDKVKITKALEAVQGSVYIKETVRLYLEAYGTDYDFSQFYIQYSDAENSESTAVIYRYNTQVYALTDPSQQLTFF